MPAKTEEGDNKKVFGRFIFQIKAEMNVCLSGCHFRRLLNSDRKWRIEKLNFYFVQKLQKTHRTEEKGKKLVKSIIKIKYFLRNFLTVASFFSNLHFPFKQSKATF